jgi:mannose-6-phosphate isomerase class I
VAEDHGNGSNGDAMSDRLQLVLLLFVVVPAGWCIIYLIFRGFINSSETADLLQERHNNASFGENAEEIRLLKEAMQYPQGSPENRALHARLKEVEKANQQAWKERVREIVSRYPSEEDLDEIAKGINPYKTREVQ